MEFFRGLHGKGAADGVGGTVKRLLDMKVAHGADVLDAETAFRLLKDEIAVKLYLVNEEDIQAIKESFEKHFSSLKPVPNTISIHQIQTTHGNSHAIFSRILSCFCTNASNRGFCNCYFLKKHHLREEEEILTKSRAIRILSYSSSDDECIIPTKCSHTIPTTMKYTVSEDRVTVLSDVRVNYDEKKTKSFIEWIKTV